MILFICSTNVFAEQSSDLIYTLQPIVVTAQKRQEILDNVPISVTVVANDKIEAMDMQNLEELSIYVPNLTITQSIYNKIFIRGAGSGLNLGFEQSVGLFFDGIYSGRSRLVGSLLFDVDRVEILKGPQGILFGKNTTAGAISILSAMPSHTFESRFSALYEPGHNEHNYEGFVTGPLNNDLSGRLAVKFNNMEGYIYNTAKNRDEPKINSQAIRGILHWDGVKNVEITAKYEFNHFKRRGAPVQITDTGGFDALFRAEDPRFEAKFNGSRSAGNDSDLFGPDFGDTSNHNAALTANMEFNDYLLTSISGFNLYNHKENFDADLSAISGLAQDRKESFYQFSQELRLHSPLATTMSWLPWNPDALDYILGAYYHFQNLEVFTNINLDLAAYAEQGLPFPPVAGSRVNQSQQQTHSWAIFAFSSWHPRTDLQISAGLRYTIESKKASKQLQVTDLGTQNPNQFLEPVFLAFNTIPHDFNESRFEAHITPMFSMQWNLNSEDMIYSTISTAYKGGGFDDNATTGELDSYEFADEFALAYEIGAKTNWLNGKININLALFRTEFKDLQVSEFDGVNFIVGNAESSVSQGIEWDSRWQATEYLSLSMAVAYLDSYFTNFANAACTSTQNAVFQASGASGLCTQDISGKSTRFAPQWSGNAYVQYSVPLSHFGLPKELFSGLKLTTQFNVNLSDEYFITADLDPKLKQQSYAKLNVRVALGDTKGHWELAFLGKNLTNTLTANDGNAVPLLGLPIGKLTERPRTLAIQLRLRF